MKAFVIGETGLLGYYATLELLKDGHEVSGIGITPKPNGGIFKSLVKYEQLDVKEATDRELMNKMNGNDWLLCAFSASSHAVLKAPAIDYYTNFNIFTIERILKIAQDTSIKKVVLLSNYLEYFNIEWASMGLARHNPYIKSIYQQEISARSYNHTNFKVVVLQLPVVYGVMPRRKPFDYDVILEKYKNKDFSYFSGGTAVMTVEQVAQAILGAFKYGQGGRSYPIAGDNLTYREINEIMMKAMNIENAEIKPIRKFRYKMKQRRKLRNWKKEKLEGGLNPLKMISFYEKNAYINVNLAQKELRIKPDNVRKQIAITAKRTLEIALQNNDI